MNAQSILPSFEPALPTTRIGEIKDLAQQVIIASSTLEGRIAAETAKALGDRLRFLNSYHSNLIEGHKTSILDIEAAMQKDYSKNQDKRDSQELCAAHVRTEKMLMEEIFTTPPTISALWSLSLEYIRFFTSSFLNGTNSRTARVGLPNIRQCRGSFETAISH